MLYSRMRSSCVRKNLYCQCGAFRTVGTPAGTNDGKYPHMRGWFSVIRITVAGAVVFEINCGVFLCSYNLLLKTRPDCVVAHTRRRFFGRGMPRYSILLLALCVCVCRAASRNSEWQPNVHAHSPAARRRRRCRVRCRISAHSRRRQTRVDRGE